MRWWIVVFVLACKGGTKSNEPPAKGSGSVVAADATTPDVAVAIDAEPPPLDPVSDADRVLVKEWFEKLKNGEKPPGVTVDGFVDEYENYFIDTETWFTAVQPPKPGQRKIEIRKFFHAVGGGKYTEDAYIEMTFDEKNQLVALKY